MEASSPGAFASGPVKHQPMCSCGTEGMLCLPTGTGLTRNGSGSVRVGPLGIFLFFFCGYLICQLLVTPAPVSAAWRSTCCPTARSGSTSVTSAPKLSTGSPTWYVTKCRMTAASTTSVRTVPRYSEFVGCPASLVSLSSQGQLGLGYSRA